MFMILISLISPIFILVLLFFAGWTNWPDCISTERPSKGSHYAKCGEDAGRSIAGSAGSWSTAEGVGSRAVHRLN